jgi:universal stress protein E
MFRSIRRILVAVKDPKAKALPAVAKAAQIAAGAAELELFHAIDTPVYIDGVGAGGASTAQIERAWSERYLEQLERIAAPLRRRGIRVRVAVEWDYPVYEAVVRRAERIRADLIVAERHGGRRVAPWLLRFTDWELLRLAPSPLLVVKSPRPYRHPVVLAAIDPTHEFAKPVRLDRDILLAATALTESLDGRLHALHAYQPLSPEMIQGLDVALIASADVTDRLERNAARIARAAFEHEVKPLKLPAARRHLVAGAASEAIPRIARAMRAGIVVMGAVSRSGLKRMLIGNTAERVLDEIACDVLIVKPARFASRMRRNRRGARVMVTPVPF